MREGFQNPSDDRIREILGTPRSVAVVGCSPDPTRDSHRIARLLRDRGHRIHPVHPAGGTILGQAVHASLRDVPDAVEMVDVFRRPEAIDAVVDDALEIGARILWLQLGVVNESAASRAGVAGMTVVMDRCPAIEYRRLFPPPLE